MSDFAWMIGLIVIVAGAAQLLFWGRAKSKDSDSFKHEVVPYVIRLASALAIPCLLAETLLFYSLIPDSRMLVGSASREGWAWFWLFSSVGSVSIFLSWIALFDGARVVALHPYLLGLSVAKERYVRLGSFGFMLLVSGLLAITLLA